MTSFRLKVAENTCAFHIGLGCAVLLNRTSPQFYIYEDVVLDENDTVWTNVRHMHMREAIDKLMADFNKFLQEHTSFRG